MPRGKSPIGALNDDPLTLAMAPPPNESEAEKAARLLAEEEAQHISDAIDEEINRQRVAEKKSPKPVKILLLGQSESGKSTTLKNFQLMNSPKAFRAELSSWKAVIQLNVVRSIRLILEAMSEAQATSSESRSSSSSPPSPSNLASSSSSPPPTNKPYPKLTSEHLVLKMRLAPLIQVEQTLMRRLDPQGTAGFEASHLSSLTNLPYSERSRNPFKEVAVNSSVWRTKFNKLLSSGEANDVEEAVGDPDEPSQVLHACSADMIQLWTDPVIQELLDMQKLRLEEMPGFFLDSLERVTGLRYVPSDDDILRARIKTLGVTEYRFKMKAGNTVGHDWRVYDVGGQRSLRAAWVPFFDNMDAIIFLAPISCFDQVLEEDSAVNRLEDSVLLWKSIVSNRLLANTDIVLFLNKCDILRQKLASGIQLSKYIVSYGDRPNDFESASSYLRRKFARIHKDHSSQYRVFYCHFTSVVDTKSTTKLLVDIQDMVVRLALRSSALI